MRGKADSPWGERPRKRETQFPEKRRALLRAAAGLFRQHGYDATSLNELAQILGITKPTVYHYVRSKDDLIVQIKSAAQDEVLDFIAEAQAGGGLAGDRLRNVMTKYAFFMTTDLGVCMALVPPRSMEPDAWAMVHAKVEKINQAIYRILEEGARDGSLKDRDPVVTYHALFGALNWMGAWYNPSGRISPQVVVEELVEILIDGARRVDAPSYRSVF